MSTHTCDPDRCCSTCHTESVARLERMSNHPSPALAAKAAHWLTIPGCKCGCS